MNLIEINNPLKSVIDDLLIEKTLTKGIEKLKKERIIASNLYFEISVALVDKESIKRYNLEYRNINEPTDVLSFCYEKTNKKIIGEMLLCFDVICEYAIDDGLSFLDEFEKNLIHSLLHIIGFEHGEKMFDLQAKLLAEIKK